MSRRYERKTSTAPAPAPNDEGLLDDRAARAATGSTSSDCLLETVVP